MLQHLLETALLQLRIDPLRHEAILLGSEGDGIKPEALHYAVEVPAGVQAGCRCGIDTGKRTRGEAGDMDNVPFAALGTVNRQDVHGRG